MGMVQEFREFAVKGNVIDLAVGVIIGGAFGKIVDSVVAMYHDQGLIPVKYLGVDKGVNVTLGLPLVRTSPDHGTAFDIAGTGRADAASLVEALRMARRLAGVEVPSA